MSWITQVQIRAEYDAEREAHTREWIETHQAEFNELLASLPAQIGENGFDDSGFPL